MAGVDLILNFVVLVRSPTHYMKLVGIGHCTYYDPPTSANKHRVILIMCRPVRGISG